MKRQQSYELFERFLNILLNLCAANREIERQRKQKGYQWVDQNWKSHSNISFALNWWEQTVLVVLKDFWVSHIKRAKVCIYAGRQYVRRIFIINVHSVLTFELLFVCMCVCFSLFSLFLLYLKLYLVCLKFFSHWKCEQESIFCCCSTIHNFKGPWHFAIGFYVAVWHFESNCYIVQCS